MPDLPTNSTPPVSEIQLADIFKFVKNNLVKFIAVGLISGALGYGLSFLLTVTFKSSSTIIPEISSSTGSLGSLSSLARLGGMIGRNESSGALQPDLYPAILQTVPFALHLLEIPVTNQDGKNYPSLEAFLHEDDKEKYVKQNNQITKKGPGQNIISLSKDQEKNVKKILNLVNSTYDVKSGMITVSVETTDPLICAQIVDASTEYLISYVSNYRAQKTTREAEFLQQRVTEIKKREQTAELALQNYRDRNRNQFLNVARIEEQRLQADYLLAQSLYSDIVRKWEDAKIRVKEEQPIIKVLEPARVAIVKSSPQRSIIAVGSSVVGILALLIWILIRKFL